MRRVFVVCSHPLLVHGIESLLRPAAGLEVVGREKDLAVAMPLIAGLRPDVLIVCEEQLQARCAPLLLQVLREQMCVRIVGLSLHENTMCIYEGTQRTITSVADLVAAIRQEPSVF